MKMIFSKKMTTNHSDDNAMIFDCMIDCHNYESTGITIEAQFTVKDKGSIIAQAQSLKLAQAIAQDYIRR